MGNTSRVEGREVDLRKRPDQAKKRASRLVADPDLEDLQGAPEEAGHQGACERSLYGHQHALGHRLRGGAWPRRGGGAPPRGSLSLARRYAEWLKKSNSIPKSRCGWRGRFF